MNSRPETGADRRAEIEAWWALIARILAFMLGALILLIQTLGETQDRWLLLAVGAALMGPAVAGGVAQIVSAIRSGHGGDE